MLILYFTALCGGALCKRYSCRTVLFLCRFFASLSTILVAFSTQLWHLHLFCVSAGLLVSRFLSFFLSFFLKFLSFFLSVFFFSFFGLFLCFRLFIYLLVGYLLCYLFVTHVIKQIIGILVKTCKIHLHFICNVICYTSMLF